MRYILLLASFLLVICACEEQKGHTAPAVRDRDSASMMTSYGVNTLISDSGVIKYRIVAERWDVNVVKNPSRWTFIKGIFFEQFDEHFHVQAYIQSDTAYYYDQKRLWHLRGRVSLRNVDGLHFSSEELYWDQQTHEFYSYQLSHIVTPEREMKGTYFRSDEHMTRYEVSNSVGSFEKDTMEETDDGNNTQQTTSADSVQTVPVRQQQKAIRKKQ